MGTSHGSSSLSFGKFLSILTDIQDSLELYAIHYAVSNCEYFLILIATNSVLWAFARRVQNVYSYHEILSIVCGIYQ